MAFRDFKVLTFDVVGTLIDFEAGIVSYIRGVGGEAAKNYSDDQILEAYRKSRASPDSGWFPDDLVRVYADMERELGLPAKGGAAEDFRNSVKDWPAFPDSVAALKRLRKRYRLVAMTNARRWALDLYAQTLDQPFDDRISADDARTEKPDPLFFAFARGRQSVFGYDLPDILHVAQSQYHDIGVAKKLGYQVCWIERRKGMKGFGGTQVVATLAEPHYHFATLGELADAVEAEDRA
jgi:putative hydrolase of the HAD superfamily